MQHPVLTIARFSLREAINSKFFFIHAALWIIALCIGLFVGEISLTETRASQLALMGGFIRPASILTLVFYVCTSIARDFSDKTVELLFSASIPRYQIFLGKYLGVVGLSFLVSVLYAVELSFFGSVTASLLWSFSLLLELCLVGLIALIVVLSLEHITLSVATTIGIYLLARVMPAIQSIGDGPFQDSLGNRLINAMVDIIDMLLPRFADFTQVSWLYATSLSAMNIGSLIIETLLYGGLFLLIGIFDLKRKTL